MPVEEELVKSSPRSETMLTIGVFDGVHLGHKYLISQLKRRAAERNLLSGVVTFSQHPEEMVSPQTRLPFLTSLEEKIELIKKEGVGFVTVLSFTPELARLSARDFLILLARYLRMRGLVVGHDFALGKDREGSIDVLRALGEEMGVTVAEVGAKRINGEVVSSTSVRSALAEGDMKRARRLLGRYFSIRGPVVAGNHIGTGLGFPTANIAVESGHALPADGVYATRAYIDGNVHQSLTNIGVRPTFGGSNERTIEVYVIDYRGNLYGAEIKIDLVDRVRGERRFDTVQDLQKQIAEDVERGKTILVHSARE